MQVIRSTEQIEIDDKNQSIWLAGQEVSDKQAKEIHTRHKQYAKRASNLASADKVKLKSAMQYERLLLEQRLCQIDEFLDYRA